MNNFIIYIPCCAFVLMKHNYYISVSGIKHPSNSTFFNQPSKKTIKNRVLKL